MAPNVKADDKLWMQSECGSWTLRRWRGAVAVWDHRSAAISPVLELVERDALALGGLLRRLGDHGQPLPTLHAIERAICCPSGRCSSPGDCYADDRSRSYPVHIRDAAEAVLRLVEGERAAACRAAMLARPVGDE